MSWRSAAVLLGATIALGAPLAGAETASSTVLVVGPGSEVWLRGTSNVAHWDCHGERFAGSLQLQAGREELEAILRHLQRSAAAGERAVRDLPDLDPEMRLEIPVRTLDCGNRVMERDLRQTLRADEHPSVVFVYRSVSQAQVFSEPETPTLYRLRVLGELHLAGASRPVALDVSGVREGEERFRVYGRLALAMTDFGLSPPVALFGLIRARDELEVAVTLVFEPAP